MAPASRWRGRSRAHTSDMGSPGKQVASGPAEWSSGSFASCHCPVVSTSPARSNLISGCSTAVTEKASGTTEDADPQVLGNVHEEGLRYAWHCLSGAYSESQLPKAMRQSSAEGRSCVCPSGVLPPSPHFRPSRAPDSSRIHQNELHNPVHFSAGGEKEHFLQMFPFHRAKSRPGIKQSSSQRSCTRETLPS